MDFERIGQVQSFLLRHRAIYSKAPSYRRLLDGEAEAAEAMRLLREEEHEALASLLRGAAGYDIHEFRDDMLGIPQGGYAWVAVTAATAPPTPVLSMDKAWEGLAIHSQEPRAVTIYWFTFLWLLLLRLFYEREGRALSQVSQYVQAVVIRTELEERVTEKLEALRQDGIGADDDAYPVAAALLHAGRDRNTTQTDIRNRVSRFLDILTKARLIERYGEDEGEVRWRQSLLCAVQVSELFSAGLIHLVPLDGMEREIASYTHSKSVEVDDGADE